MRFTATVCSFTRLCDESHNPNITCDLCVPPYTPSALMLLLTISQPASFLHVALIPSAGFCVQSFNFYVLNSGFSFWNTPAPFALELVVPRALFFSKERRSWLHQLICNQVALSLQSAWLASPSFSQLGTVIALQQLWKMSLQLLACYWHLWLDSVLFKKCFCCKIVLWWSTHTLP